MNLFNKLFGTIRPEYRTFGELKPSECFMWDGDRFIKLNETQAYYMVGDTGVLVRFYDRDVVQKVACNE